MVTWPRAQPPGTIPIGVQQESASMPRSIAHPADPTSRTRDEEKRLRRV